MVEKEEETFIFPFEKLEIWELAIGLADFVLGLLESVAPNKYFRLVGQIQAAFYQIRN